MKRVPIASETDIGAARRTAREVAHDAALSDADAERAALVASEMASNVLKHGGGGMMLAGPHRTGGATASAGARSAAEAGAVDLVALDKGRGIPDLRAALADGYSSLDSLGTGLGAVRRQSERFDVFSRTDKGTTVVATVGPGHAPQAGEIAVEGLTVPHPREEVSGDAWTAARHGAGAGAGLDLVLADGLGHGPRAQEASEAACRALETHAGRDLGTIAREMESALKGSRGAALLCARLPSHGGRLEAFGTGNIGGLVYSGRDRQGLVSRGGVVGLGSAPSKILSYDLFAGATIVLYTDGLHAVSDLEGYGDLLTHDPLTVAATLYRDFRRDTDDAGVVVVRRRPD